MLSTGDRIVDRSLTVKGCGQKKMFLIFYTHFLVNDGKHSVGKKQIEELGN